MAEESLSNKLWKLASYGLGYGTEESQNKKDENASKSKKLSRKLWPSFVRPSGMRKWGGYDEPNAKDFDMRAKNYLNDGIKKKSLPSLFRLADLEIYECTLSESYHIATHKKSYYQRYVDKLPSDTFFLIYNMQLTSLDTAVVATFVLKTNQPQFRKDDDKFIEDILDDLSSSDEEGEEEEDEKNDAMDKNIVESKEENAVKHNDDQKATPPPLQNEKDKEKKEKKITFTVEDIESIPNIEQVAHSKVVDDDNLWCPKLGYAPLDKYIWKRFLRGDELFINQRLKIIPKMVEGGWYFTFPQRPSIIGMKTPQRSYRGSNYLEIDCEADQNIVARQITKAAWHISTYLAVDIMLTIEGQKNDELPERALGGFRIKHVDTTKAIKLVDKK